MIRFLFVRLILPLLLFLLLRAILKSIWGSLNSSVAHRDAAAPQFRTGGELKKDPVCGTFVPVSTAVTKNVNGQLVHFCSTTCRDKYKVA